MKNNLVTPVPPSPQQTLPVLHPEYAEEREDEDLDAYLDNLIALPPQPRDPTPPLAPALPQEDDVLQAFLA